MLPSHGLALMAHCDRSVKGKQGCPQGGFRDYGLFDLRFTV